jgi:hypothetical protein
MRRMEPSLHFHHTLYGNIGVMEVTELTGVGRGTN